MNVDPEYLRRYYSSLSDEAFQTIERAELTEMGQSCYDAEVSRRGLAVAGNAAAADEPRELDGPFDEGAEAEWNTPGTDEEPAWLAEGAEVYSEYASPGRHTEDRIADARHLLEAAGVPCHLEVVELTPEEKAPPVATHRWRLVVPAKLDLRAMSVLERDLSNPDFEAGWRTQLEACSDKELSAMHPKIVFCGLFDRIDRVTKAYQEEIARRRLRP